MPKGVMLTHRNLVTTSVGGEEFLMCGKACSTDDVWYAYLPLAHIFERVAHILFMYSGAKWAFSSGDITKLLEELGVVQPTVFGAVPRVLSKLYDKINAGLSASCIKSYLVGKAMASKRANYLDHGIVTKDTWW